MISLVLYGRNDNYGYNLHKRAALSLNCMAEVLSCPDDEILFVDYNTADDFPTFPEAIQDTLTDRCKARLRILRVRPHVHDRLFRKKSHLVALEPVSRNVALRHSNPNNRWILSTNTDMIFVPRGGADLTEVARGLPDAYWGIPRYELPETLWEGLDRRDPAGIIAQIGRWGWSLHLNEVVLGAKSIRFDAPGDFQLMPRQALFDMHGFDEAMLLGWHVDSNIAKRMMLVYGEPRDLSDRMFGYHCDHTRQVTPMHRRRAVQNRISRFVDEVTAPEVPAQADSWGCAGEEIEEIRLSAASAGIYLSSLAAAIRAPLAEPIIQTYVSETYNKVGYQPAHVLPFLLDLFISQPRRLRIAWLGGHRAMLELFQAASRAAGRDAPILVPSDRPMLLDGSGMAGLQPMPMDDLLEAADALVFDFVDAKGGPLLTDKPAYEDDGTLSAVITKTFLQALAIERDRLRRGTVPRRFVAVNAIHNDFEMLISNHINISRTPFSVRLRSGFVMPEPEGFEAAVPRDAASVGAKTANDWLTSMQVGPAGQRTPEGIAAIVGKSGCVAYGPYLHPPPGRFAVRAEIAVGKPDNRPQKFATGSAGASVGVRRAIVPPVLRPAARALKRWLRAKLGDNRARQLRSLAYGLRSGVLSDTFGSGPAEINLELCLGDRVLAHRLLVGSEVRPCFVDFEFEASTIELGRSPFDSLELRMHSNGRRAAWLCSVVARELAKTESVPARDPMVPSSAGAAAITARPAG